MVSRIAALLCLALTGARADLDLTPIAQTVSFEGTAHTQTGFRNGTETVTYDAPAGWSLEGQGARLQMRPPEVSMASAVIEGRSLRGATLDEEGLARLQKEIAASLPREAQEITWEPAEANPLLLNRHETRRLTVSYAAFGQRFRTTAVVCNFAQQQMLFRLDARADDFAKLYNAFRRSLYSWQGLP